MADQIARLNVMLTANAQPFDKTVADAGAKLGQFAALANNLKSGSISGIVQSLGSLGGINLSRPLEGVLNLASHLPGPIGQAAGAVAQILPAIQEAARAVFDLVAGVVDSGRASARELLAVGRQFGTTGDEAQGLRLAIAASGRSLDEARPTLMRFNRALGQAVAGSVEARRQFEGMGLDFQRLQSLTPTERFAELARHFNSLRDPIERDRQAMQLFGRNAHESLMVLRQFERGAFFTQLARRTRSGLDEEMERRFRAVQEAERMTGAMQSATTQGFTQHAAAAVVPGVTLFQQGMQRAMEFVQPAINAFLHGLDQIGHVFAGWVSFIQQVADIFTPIWEAAQEFSHTIVDAMSSLGDGRTLWQSLADTMAGLFRTVIRPLVEIVAATVRRITELIASAQRLRDSLPGGGQGGGGGLVAGGMEGQGVPQLVGQQIEQMVESMRAQRLAIGGSSIAAQLQELRSRGANEDALQPLIARNAQLQVARVNQSLRDQVTQLTHTAEGWQQLQLMREGANEFQVREIQAMQDRVGIIQTYLQLQREAASMRDATALTAGSRQAIEAVHRFQQGGETRDVSTLLRQAIELQAQRTQENSDRMRELRDAMHDAGLVVIRDGGPAGG